MDPYERTEIFRSLFDGRRDVIGTNAGGVKRVEVMPHHYAEHLDGAKPIGIFPVRDDGTVKFAAVDLDEPDFELAAEIAELLPGPVWLEASRSGNAHGWAFFDTPLEAWAAKAVLRAAVTAVGRPDVEVFPKQDALRPGMVGNYINLPFCGVERPILWRTGDEHNFVPPGYAVEAFLQEANAERASAEEWRQRAMAIGARPPEEREASDFRERTTPHVCATYMLEHKDDNPLQEGHRAVVLFNLAKMLANVATFDEGEVLDLVETYNQAGTAPVPASEVRRFVGNAFRGEFTSTGCDDALMAPYISPDCPIGGRG